VSGSSRNPQEASGKHNIKTNKQKTVTFKPKVDPKKALLKSTLSW
jgi:hypothetical protein